MIRGKLPARLSLEQTAWVLGFGVHDISVLISARLIKPLGRPTTSGSKYFATVELEKLASDMRWLAKASDALVNYWRAKNAGRKGAAVPSTRKAFEAACEESRMDTN